MAFAGPLLMLAAPSLQIRDEARLPAGIGAGFFGGVLGGVAAMPGPMVPRPMIAALDISLTPPSPS